MSLWLYKREPNGRRTIYSVGIPPQVVLALTAMLAALLAAVVSLL